MAGELHFHLNDAYPGMGFANTAYTTLPDAEDQQALVDDQKLAEQESIQQSATSHKGILITFAIGILLIIFLGKVG